MKIKILRMCSVVICWWNNTFTKIKVRVISFARNSFIKDERGDIPGWVLVVLMTTGLVTAIWAIAAPRLSEILRHSLDSMNSIG